MIPKKIHYCWFGQSEKPKLAQKCIESWKKFCPDYELIEWNEENFDIHRNPYTEMCHIQRKYAFLTDYVRLWVVYQYGGIYMDTDVELIRPLDTLLKHTAYFGFENNEYINTGIGFGAEKNHLVIQKMLREYDVLLDGKHGTIGCPILNTRAMLSLGLQQNGAFQKLEDCTVYPAEYFNPYDDLTGRLKKTQNTYSIHWYAKTWVDKKSVFRSRFTRPFHRIFGTDCFARFQK